MIVKNDKDNLDHLFSIDIGRPDVQPKEEIYFEQVKRIQAWIKETPHEVVVSGAWVFVEEYIEKKHGYLGGAMMYMFWFVTEEGRQAFIDELGECYGKDHSMAVLKARNEEMI